MAQFATTFGSKERKAKAKARGANYSHRRRSTAGVVQTFNAGNGCEVNVVQDGDTSIVVTIKNGYVSGKPSFYTGSNARNNAVKEARVLSGALKLGLPDRDPRSEVRRVADNLMRELSPNW